MIFKNDKISIIAVDDREDILELSKIFLEKANEDLQVETTTDPGDVIDRVGNSEVDAIISDYDMPQMTGVELLENIREYDEDLPFILHTGKGTEEIAEEAIGAGVTDYFRKDSGTEHYSFIAKRVEEAVAKYRETEMNQILRKTVELSHNPIVVTNTDSEIVYANPAYEQVSGYSLEELTGENANILSSGTESLESFEEMYNALERGDTHVIKGMLNKNKSGETYEHDQTVAPIIIHNGSPDYFIGISNVK